MRRFPFVFLLAGLLHAPAYAQETYVSASLTGDVVRLSRPGDSRQADFSGGEAIGFALRLGTRLCTALVVEAEFAGPTEIRHEGTPAVIPLPAPPVLTVTAPDGTLITIPRPQPEIFPPLNYRVRTEYRDAAIAAGIWARQELSARFALVYSGGVGFHRTEREVELAFEPPGLPEVLVTADLLGGVRRSLISRGPSTYAAEAVEYTARPFAGIDARIAMMERLHFVPGIRLHGLSGGLLVRPSAGLSWDF